MRLIRLVLFVPLAWLLAGCGEPVYRQQAYVFGTQVEISLYGEDAAKAQRVVAEILADFDQLHPMLHPWAPGTISRVNAQIEAGATRVSTSPGVMPVLSAAKRYAELSDGLFDPGIGNLVRLWGFHAETFEARLPEEAAIAKLVAAAPSLRDLDFEDYTVVSRNPAVRIDLGGIAKGYALDLAAERLRQKGVRNALINIGGNVLALGRHGDRPWVVGIQHPRRAGAMATVELQDGEAIGTSGDYQRYFELNGKRYCHILDPRTGRPVEGVQAVTVIARGLQAGLLSDVASKPLFVAGADGWQAMAQRLGVTEALFIDAAGQVQATVGMAQRLTWEGVAPPLTVVP